METELSEFNTLAHKFLSVMEKTFPDEKKITLYKLTFEAIRKTSEQKPVEMFMENLSGFGVQIMQKDEKFFQNDQYVKSVENISGKIGLIKYWDDMNDTSKETIWEYVQSLYALGMLALGRIDEFREIVEIVNKS